MIPPNVNLNLNIRGLSPSATLAINEASAKRRREGRQVFGLGFGQSPFPVPHSVVEELKKNAHQKDYLPVKGLGALREAVADYHHRTQGIECTGDDVLIGPGSKELMFILQLVHYGDLILPSPSWVSYAPQARIIGRHVYWLQTNLKDGWRLAPEEIEKLCREDPHRPRLLILNYPANPGGGTYRAEALEALAEMARQYRLVLLSDEIYGELHHEGEHVSIARYYPEGTIVSGGLSKWCGAGGWRLGTFVFPRSLHGLRDAMAVVASETFTATSAPIQYAAVRAFRRDNEMQQYLRQARRILKAAGRHCTQKLREAGVAVSEPRGGFYIFPDFGHFEESLNARNITTSEELCERLIEETGVALLPGSVFGRPPQEFTARLAYVDFDGARALAAAMEMPPDKDLDKDFLGAYGGNVLTAIDRICEWLPRQA
jgi:aspartate aminotransferase